MSQRVKRPNRTEDGCVPIKRRKRTVAEEEEAASLAAVQAAQGAWQPRSNDLKTIYNRTTTEAPAELFRKDLISAMKLPDSEPLAQDEYWVITDQWKQEWERGVQVPVNPDSLPEPSVCVKRTRSVRNPKDFKLPKNKYIRITKDDHFNTENHTFSNAPAQAEAACSYDLDECDVSWLRILNAERVACGLNPIFEHQLELVIERLELCCWERIQSILRNEEGLGIEYDENVICDVCRSPDSEDGNEMVFCDSCNICVHQACYGITKIPEGQWLCCTCNIGKRPDCMLCPNKGGAMKSTRTGHKWAHVSCALWIPEVSIGCVEKMEPITKISSIPSSRWALICVLCRERRGACIQCSVKTCKTAYHVTCAFKHGLEMRAIIEDENADDGVKLRSYCEKHSKSSKKSEKSICSGSEDDDLKRRKRKDMTNEEKNQARAARLQEIEAEFFKHVTIKDINMHLEVDNEALVYIYNYWKLKRKAEGNKPLLPPKSDDVDVLSHKREQADLEKMKMFVQLRQDLERVRNLCYMVSRREKLSRSFFRMREQTFHKQAAVLDSSNTLPTTVIQAVIEANHGPSIYDRLYSHNEAEDHTSDFDIILARIAGIKTTSSSGNELKSDANGLFRNIRNNPYKKLYFNGSSKRRSGSLYGSSLSSEGSSDERPKDNKENQYSSSEDDKNVVKTKFISRKQNIGRRRLTSQSKFQSSSEDDIKPNVQPSRSRLSQIASELGDTGTDSDELLPIKTSRKMDNQKRAMSSLIYSDSENTDVSLKNDDKSSNTTNDSQSKLRTKAAMKEFSNKPRYSKSSNKGNDSAKIKSKNGSPSKTDYVSSDLIVPQRQAAKKASENLKLTNRSKEQQQNLNQLEEASVKSFEDKKDMKTKQKGKSSKEKDLQKEGDLKEKKKDGKLIDVATKDIDAQDILAFVPQRQAAKKAAEHIKSGLGKPAAAGVDGTQSAESIKKDSVDMGLKIKKDESKHKMSPIEKESVGTSSPAKISETKRKSSQSLQSSSSTASSSSSSESESTSSSESEVDTEKLKQSSQPQSDGQVSTTSPREPAKRSSNAKDWPFLDKAARSAASSSFDSSDSSTQSTPRNTSPSSQRKTSPSTSRTASPTASRKPTATATKKALQDSPRKSSSTHTRKSSPVRQNASPVSIRGQSPTSRKSGDTKTIDTPGTDTAIGKRGRKSSFDKNSVPTIPNREEPIRRGRVKIPRGRPTRTSQCSSDRLGDTNVGSRNLPDDQCISMETQQNQENRKGKQNATTTQYSCRDKKEKKPPTKLLPQVTEKSEQLREKTLENESETRIDLEREIRERKADKEKDGIMKSKSTLDILFSITKTKLFESEKEQLLTKFEKDEDTVQSKCDSNESVNLSNVLDENDKSQRSTSSNEELVENIEDKSEKSSFDVKEENPLVDETRECLMTSKSFITNKNVDERKNVEKIVIDHYQPLDEQCNFEITPNISLSVTNAGKASLNYDHECSNTSKPSKVIQNKSVFSPQTNRCSDILDIVHFEDNFGLPKEVVSKNSIQFCFNNSSIKEDTKEDSARETLNLVEKLRMGLSKKSNSAEIDERNVVHGIDIDNVENMEQVVPDNSVQSNSSDATNTNMHPSGFLNHSKVTHSKLDLAKESQESYLSKFAPTDDLSKSHLHPQEMQHSGPLHDEHWVPPSENYSNLKPNSFKKKPSFVTHNNASQLAQPQQSLGQEILPNSLSNENLKDTSLISSNESRIPQTPMSCLPSPSPYPDIHPQAKWADSTVMPSRRSSSSSSNSSSGSRKEEEYNKVSHDVRLRSEMPLFITSQVPTFSATMENFRSYPDPAFVPVSLFPPPSLNAQLSFTPTSSTGVYPPAFGAPFPTPSSIPSSAKPTEDSIPYHAAFTSSEHNMALTAAMVNIPSTSLQDDHPVALSTKHEVKESSVSDPSIQQKTTNVLKIEVPIADCTSPSPNKSVKNAIGKKSPSKPTRMSARVTSQQMNKSPAKSPGKSPRQEPIHKNSGTGRGRGDKRGQSKSNSMKAQMSNKGRGRGKGRGRVGNHNDFDFMSTNTIHNKLIGTVYDLDFDDDISNDNMTDLKSMRERRKSVDLHERKTEVLASPKSPKFSSPKNRFNADLRELKPPSPLEEKTKREGADNVSTQVTFPDVTPVLPGPVDMRTYNSSSSNSFDQTAYNEHNLLNAFASGTAGSQVNDELDEDFEKELHTALTEKKTAETPVPTVFSSSSHIKVSLSDSRNQLKVKIKGPIANYTSTVTPLPPPTDNVTNTSVNLTSITTNNLAGTSSVGTSNLRRMRKKELLRQYWTQDMNMDDPSSNSSFTATPTAPPINRTTITIPKAVASMTTIPTKEDYRDYRTDDNMETTKHKKSRALSRELKQLDVTMDDVNDRRRSNENSNVFDLNKHKSRGRPARPPQTTPKLKIKIGATNSIVADEKLDEKNLRPPKKRIASSIAKPSVEDLMRDSMKFRKQVMADMKVKKKKRDKSDKHKRKEKKKDNTEVRIISGDTTSTKLIIRFGKPKISDCDVRTNQVIGKVDDTRTKDSNEPENVQGRAEEEKLPRLTPIKLKISRCVEGSGYVMKPPSEGNSAQTEEDQTSQPGQPPPRDSQKNSEPNPLEGLPQALQQEPPPLPLNKDCEVR